jgi:hypothetical protein
LSQPPEKFPHHKKASLAKRLFSTAGRAVGQAGMAVGGVAGGLLRSAGQTAKGATDRARLTFSGEVAETPPWDLRTIAESLTRWLVEEHQGRTDLQHQKPPTIELTELGQVGSFFEIVVEESGLLGRRFRFLLRSRPLSELSANFPSGEQTFHAELLLVMNWPRELLIEPDVSCLVWGQAAAVGPRNSAQDLGQRWLESELGGTFARKKILPRAKLARKAPPLPYFGGEDTLNTALGSLLTPTPGGQKLAGILALAAPGGTGKSYFLKCLHQRTENRVIWAGVDHQGLREGDDGVEVLSRVLANLAKSLETQGVSMARFSKEYRLFQKSRDSADSKGSGFLSHFRKAAETAAGINPIFGAASAGVAFLTSWGQEMKEESEALAKDDSVMTLTRMFVEDLEQWSEQEKAACLLWRRPVLVFDTYEWLAPLIDVWVRTQLLSQDLLSKAEAAVLVAGRDHLLKTDTRWTEWQHLTTCIELRPFSRETAAAYLRSLGSAEERLEELYQMTQGSPLFLSLVAHIKEPDQAYSILSTRILEEVPDPDRGDFVRASILENFDPSSLGRIFPERSPQELEQLLTRLKQATFTVESQGRRAFLPSVRKVLQRNLLMDIGPDAFAQLETNMQDA